VIADRTYRIKTSPKDEEAVRKTVKIINDKTYCFWAHPNDPIVIDLKPIINRYYNNVVINGGQKQNISDQPYYLIRSIDLYNYLRDKLLIANIPILNYSTNELSINNDIYTIKTSHGNLFTYHLFDSAPPQNETPHSNIIHLHQSFYGVKIKCDHALFQENTFEMMNFDVDQNNFTQFIYTLPYSSNEALIELTRFGAEKIDIDYAKAVINEALQNKVGKFEIIDEEIGCIPMTTHLHQPSIYRGILKTGTNANLIKPSTGYGFKNMFHFAEMVKNEIKNAERKDLNILSLKVKKRFRFYDTLLLIILLYWPKEGKRIFTKLFLAQNVKTIFLFLDEQTSLMQEVNIFKSLPLAPFLKSLLVYAVKHNFMRYLITAVTLLLYFIIKQYNPTIALYYSYLCVTLGLLWVGIPHGALDHLTISNGKKSLSFFVVKYLITIIVYYFFWQFFPSIALLFFIMYSSFHFGESELQEINITTTTVSTYLKALALGASILIFIILTHFHESIEIIINIKGLEFIKLYEEFLVKYAFPIAILA
jgi:lycopene beta-cyclase